jgi:hypothetical protein
LLRFGLCTFARRIRAFDGLSFPGFRSPSRSFDPFSAVKRRSGGCVPARQVQHPGRGALRVPLDRWFAPFHGRSRIAAGSSQPVRGADLAVVVRDDGLGSSVSKVLRFDSSEDEPAGIPSPAWYHPCGWCAAKSVRSGSCAVSFRFNGIRVPMNRLRVRGCPRHEEGVDSRPSWGS